jgi:CRP/FNR family transcriptional regulator
MQENNLFRQLPFFPEPAFREELLLCQVSSFNKGDVIVREGQYVKFLPIVLSGSIRVFQKKEDREVLLYYVKPDETCTMSLAAAYFNNKSTSHGVVMEPTDVLIFPADLILSWQLKYPSWNQYVMRMFRSRYDQLINALEGLAFDHIPHRVWNYLQHSAADTQSKKISISHDELARELGTTRVVISRILKQLENEKRVKLLRGAIELL